MNIIETTNLDDKQKAAIMHIWNNEYPEQLMYASLADFDNYLDNLADKRHLLFVDDNGEILGWAFTFLRDGETWFAIILDSSIHGMGYGTKLLDRLQLTGTKLNGWVVDHENNKKQNGMVYRSPLAFYLKNDFVLHLDIRLETAKLSAVKISWNK